VAALLVNEAAGVSARPPVARAVENGVGDGQGGAVPGA